MRATLAPTRERRARTACPAGFEALVRSHQSQLRYQLRRLTKGYHALADDLAQETFVLAWRHGIRN
jgi:DNA-directed RNA polymerase specialized sigma24 family protein